MEELNEVQKTIKAARDSVWVIESTIEQIDGGDEFTEEFYNLIDRNVGHLKNVVARTEITESDEDITDLNAAITAGETRLSAYKE